MEAVRDIGSGGIINLLMVMALIWSAGVLFRRINQPPILGELLAGIIFGPCCLGLIMPDDTLNVLAELGIFFLMFYAGLETNEADLKHSTLHSIAIGSGGFFLPLAAGYLVCTQVFGYGPLQSVFAGLGLSITAIAISARVLKDMSLMGFRVSPIILGSAIIDDVLAMAALSAVIGISNGGGGLNWLGMLVIFTKVIMFFIVAIIVGNRVFPLFEDYFSSREAKGFTFALIVALVFGIMAELAGLHLIIGAYLAGLFVRKAVRSPALMQKIDDRFVAISYGFLGPIFFVSLAFHVTFDIFVTHMPVIIALVIVASAGKVMGAGGAAMLVGMTRQEAGVIALAMNGRGAVELIIASIGLRAGIIDDSLFSILVVMAFLTTFLSPVTLSMMLRRTHTEGLLPLKK